MIVSEINKLSLKDMMASTDFDMYGESSISKGSKVYKGHVAVAIVYCGNSDEMMAYVHSSYICMMIT
jgi:hypothetical protein